MDSYQRLLRNPRWQKKRLEIMSRDNWACQFCLDTDSPLQVHHDYYEYGRKPWQYPSEMLRTLCDACHELVHNRICDPSVLKQHIIDRYCFGTLTFDAVIYLFCYHPEMRAA